MRLTIIRGVPYYVPGDGRVFPMLLMSDQHMDSVMDAVVRRFKKLPDLMTADLLLRLIEVRDQRRELFRVTVDEVGNPYYNKANLCMVDHRDERKILRRIALLALENHDSLMEQVIDAFLVLQRWEAYQGDVRAIVAQGPTGWFRVGGKNER